MSDYTQLKEQMNEIDDANARIEALEAENAELREAAQWIPVTERLPDHPDDVLTFCGDVALGSYYNKWWPSTRRKTLYWMPLPESPLKRDGKEQKLMREMEAENTQLREAAFQAKQLLWKLQGAEPYPDEIHYVGGLLKTALLKQEGE